MNEVVSKNFYKGRMIKSAKELYNLSMTRKCVYHYNWRVIPAAFICSMQFRIVHRNIEAGNFFHLKSKK